MGVFWGGSRVEKYGEKNTIFNSVKRALDQALGCQLAHKNAVGNSAKDFTEVHVNIHIAH